MNIKVRNLLKQINIYEKEFKSDNVEEILDKGRELVLYFDEAYRKENELISDSEFDNLYIALEEAEEVFPELFDKDSPTQKITDTIVDELKKVEHTSFMGSQDKVKTEEEILKFINTIKGEYSVEYKLDGLTIVLRYSNGKLKTAITRGDGYVGEDVTHTIKTFRNVPKDIQYKKDLELRMEAIMTFEDFELNNIDGSYSNPRNLVSGTVRNLDASKVRERNIKGIVFDIISCEEKFETSTEALDFLKSLGFEVVESKVFKNEEKDKLINYCTSFEKKEREGIPYMLDGLVIKAHSLKEREELGYGRKSPKWSVAFKFKSLDATTYLRDVEWKTGKTGKLSPIGIIDEIEIDNVKINRVTLNNIEWIKKMNVSINDKIIVARSNDVIPKLTKVIEGSNDKPLIKINFPKKCPACQGEVVKKGAHVFCENKNCSAQSIKQIISWCSKGRMNIDTLGEKTIEQLYDNGLVRSISDIYKLKDKKEEFINLERQGEKSFENAIKAIEKSKEKGFDKVLYGLSIPNIGEVASQDLAEKVESLDNIMKYMKNQEDFKKLLLEIKDFGEVMANNVIDFFKDEEKIALLNKLKDLGLKMKLEKEAKDIDSSDRLKDLVFVITGTLSQSRNYFKDLIVSNGGKVTGSVSKNTDYLLAGEKAGSKLVNANKLGVKVISEEDFMNLLNQ